MFKIIRVIHIPMKQKYRCYLQSNWRLAVSVLMKVLRIGIPIARRSRPELFSDFWAELSTVFEDFFFPASVDDQRQEDRVADESVDCQLIELLREEVLPYPAQV